MSQWSAPWNAPKPQVEEVFKPVQEETPTQTTESAVEAPVVEEPAVVEETVEEAVAPKKTTKKTEATPAE